MKLKIGRWAKLPPGYDPACCEGPELECYTTSENEYHGMGCTKDVGIECWTDNGSHFKVCPGCAYRLGFRDATGK